MSLLSFEAYKRWFRINTDVVCSYLLHFFLNAIFWARIGRFKVGISQFLLQEEPPSKTRCGLGSTEKCSFHSGWFCRPGRSTPPHCRHADGRLLEERDISEIFPNYLWAVDFSPRGLLTALTFTLSFLPSSFIAFLGHQ